VDMISLESFSPPHSSSLARAAGSIIVGSIAMCTQLVVLPGQS
jgi:hypothetical protein